MKFAIAATAALAALTAVAPPAAAQTAAPATAVEPPLAVSHVPAGALVEIELTQAVSSRTMKRGDKFTLKLSSPIRLDGQVLVAEGASGVGEVIDAAPSGPLGRPAKLLLAVRYVEADGRQVRLKGLQIGASGSDNTNLIAAAAVVPIGGLFAGFIHGGEIEIPAGTRGVAKLAADLAAAPPAAPATAPITPSETNP
ncbi:MAG: hypothetical protein JF588_15190 [Caulobacterales bacterium]|nr:hypothetical protein [Caulobacterales bacterium]